MFRIVSFALFVLYLVATDPAESAEITTAPSVATIVPWFVPSDRYDRDLDEPWSTDRAHPFLVGGFAFMSTTTVDSWFLSGWHLSAGAELPVRPSWALVPRFHMGGAEGDDSGTIQWARLALDGRLSSVRAGTVYYQEAGLGMGAIGSPVRLYDSHGSRLEQRWSGTPFMQFVTGAHADSDAPNFVTEFVYVLGLGAVRPSSLELLVGLEF